MPLFSIITINRNNADGLRKTMQSVLSQDFSDYEYIIIDGASTDKSVDVIREFLAVPEYASKISYWVSEPDSGIYNAMNKGIRHANGEFVNMMNSGDTMLPEVLGRVAKIAAEHKGEVLYGAVNCVKNNKFIFVAAKPIDEITSGMMPHQAIFVPLEMHKKYGLYSEEYKICSDFDLILKMYNNGVAFFYTQMIIANYDFDGFSINNEKLMKAESLQIIKKYGYYKEPTFKQRIKMWLQKILRQMRII